MCVRHMPKAEHPRPSPEIMSSLLCDQHHGAGRRGCRCRNSGAAGSALLIIVQGLQGGVHMRRSAHTAHRGSQAGIEVPAGRPQQFRAGTVQHSRMSNGLTKAHKLAELLVGRPQQGVVREGCAEVVLGSFLLAHQPALHPAGLRGHPSWLFQLLRELLQDPKKYGSAVVALGNSARSQLLGTLLTQWGQSQPCSSLDLSTRPQNIVVLWQKVGQRGAEISTLPNTSASRAFNNRG